MAVYMTISEAVDALDLFDAYNAILETYEADFYEDSEIETDLKELMDEHEETYEFTPDEDGDYTESLERNMKEALGLIFEEHGVEHLLDEEFADDAMDDDDIADIYDDSLEAGSMDDDEELGFGEDDNFF